MSTENIPSAANPATARDGRPPVVVVTGGGRGIGAAVSRQAAAAGYAVLVNYVSGADAAEALVAELVGAGGRAVAVRGDVSDEADVVAMFDAAERLGTVVALINNAGITGPHGRFENVSAAELRRVMDINVVGAMLCAREAVRRMSTRNGGAGGCVVNISSRAAVTGSATEWVHYAASKAAIDTFTFGLAQEVAAEGIRVNGVAPGLIETDLHATAGQPGRPERMAPGIPARRAGLPDEVAPAVLWLLSPAAGYVAGTTIAVSGGR